MTKIGKFSFSGTNSIEAQNIFIQRIKDSHKIYDKFHSDFLKDHAQYVEVQIIFW